MLLTLLISGVLAIAQAAQTPDFAGTWTIDVVRSSAVGGGNGSGRGNGRGGGGGGLGLGQPAEELTITQTPDSLTVAERRFDSTSRVVLRLDGRETTNRIAAGRNSGGTATSTSTWKDGRLLTAVATPSAPGSRDIVRYTETRYIDAGALVVEVTMAGSQNSRRTVYQRK